MKTYCLLLDLQNDPELIEEYKRYHQPENIWPEVTANIKNQGILREEIYLAGTRLVMILHTTDDFTFEAKKASDLANSKMQEWETLMWKYQKPAPGTRSGEKWLLTDKIFEVGDPL